MADETTKAPRQLSREALSWANQGGFLGAVRQEVARTDPLNWVDDKEEEKIFSQLPEICAPIKAVMSKRHGRITAGGFEVIDGTGPKAELYGKIARAMIDSVSGWQTVLESALRAELLGWQPFEVGRSRGPATDIEGTPVFLPTRVREGKPWDFAYDERRDLILRAGDASPVERHFATSPDRPMNAHHARWFTPTYGSTSNPYGRSAYRDVWLDAVRHFEWSQLMTSGLSASLGKAVVSGVDPGKIDEVAAQMVKVRQHDRDENVLIKVLGLDYKINYEIAFQEGWTGALEYLARRILMALTGSHLSASQPDQGARAAAMEHGKAPSEQALTLARWLGTEVDERFLRPWFALSGIFPTAEEMPHYATKLRHLDHAILQIFIDHARDQIDGAALANEGGIPLLDPGGFEWDEKQELPPALAQGAGLVEEEGEEAPSGDDPAEDEDE